MVFYSLEFVMGGIHGIVRGNSKIDTYLKYTMLVEEQGNGLLDRNPDPENKKGCKKLMERDPETGEWVLHYHLHS